MVFVNRDDLYEYVYASPMFQRWHWYQFVFDQRRRGNAEHPFARSVLDACLDCELHLPGFALAILDRIARVGGRDRNQNDYEQLLEICAEILVVRQVVTFRWPFEVGFEHEPLPPGSSKKNPELLIRGPKLDVGIEVKAPQLSRHNQERSQNALQLTARQGELRDWASQTAPSGITFPRDNPVKDFLVSANAKFEPFSSDQARPFSGILVVVWNDFINEPLSALLSPASGLFTPASFHRTNDPDSAIKFPHVSGVVLIRHLHQFIRAAGDDVLVDGLKHAMDYGRSGSFPFKAWIANPDGAIRAPKIAIRALQAVEANRHLGAEYIPGEFISWMPSGEARPDPEVDSAELRKLIKNWPDGATPPGRFMHQFGERGWLPRK